MRDGCASGTWADQAGTGRAITMAGEFNSADHDGVQQFKFADGSQLSRTDILAKLHPPTS